MSDKKPTKLDEVNATLDRFAKLIEENSQQLRKDKAEFDRQQAEDRVKDEKRQAEWEQQRAEDLAKDEKRQAEWERQRAEDLAKDEKRQAEWERQRAEDRVKDEKRQAEWERRDAGLGKKIAALSDQVGGQGNSIGDITETITISDNILDLINDFVGIEVTHLDFNTRKKYPAIGADGKQIRKQYEVDGLVYGQKVVVVIEAKTTLTKDYIEAFVKKLPKFKLAYPDYSHKDIYGAVTFIRADDQALELAEQSGLFIIKASPPDATLINSQDFKPAKFF